MNLPPVLLALSLSNLMQASGRYCFPHWALNSYVSEPASSERTGHLATSNPQLTCLNHQFSVDLLLKSPAKITDIFGTFVNDLGYMLQIVSLMLTTVAIGGSQLHRLTYITQNRVCCSNPLYIWYEVLVGQVCLLLFVLLSVEPPRCVMVIFGH